MVSLAGFPEIGQVTTLSSRLPDLSDNIWSRILGFATESAEIEYPEGHHIINIQFHRRAPLSPNVTRRNVLLVCKRFYVSRLIISLWSCHTDESTRSASVCRICMLSPSSGPAIIRNGYWTPWNNRQISLLTFASSG